MTAPEPEARGDLWSFCTRVYAAPGAAAACLELQEESGADICLLLAALWSAVAGPGLLKAADLDALDELVAPFRDNVVRPLRQVRRWMKEAGYHPDPLRERIKADELAAEQREIAFIAYRLTHKAWPSGEQAPAGEALAGFLRWLGAGDASRLAPVVAAAQPCSRSR